MSAIYFRWLPPSEFQKLENIFREHDWPLPHPAVGSIRVAENESGEIVAFVSCEVLPHLGPGWISPDHRTNPTIWEDALYSMQERISQQGGIFPGIIMIAETEASERIAQRLGMSKSKGVLYIKER